MEMAATTTRLTATLSESEEEILDEEQGVPAAKALSARTSWGRAVVGASVGLAVLGLVGLFISTRAERRTLGHAASSKHLGSRMTLNALGSNLDFYSSAPRQTQANSSSPIIPMENTHDGNVCPDSEELFGGLCYTKCSTLAPGYTKRTSAFTCGQEGSYLNFRHDFGFCSGFSVSGATGGNCPHKPGVCLANEEPWLGECYEKCSILTNGEYPNRVGGASCCKTEGITCLNPFNDRTDTDFNVGGGAGDGDPSTPAAAHGPLTAFTEAR